MAHESRETLLDHGDGTYSLRQRDGAVILDRVGIFELTEFLADRHQDRFPGPSPDEIFERAWDAGHPPLESPIEISLPRPAVVSLSRNSATDRLTVKQDGEIVASEVSLHQLVGAAGGEGGSFRVFLAETAIDEVNPLATSEGLAFPVLSKAATDWLRERGCRYETGYEPEVLVDRVGLIEVILFGANADALEFRRDFGDAIRPTRFPFIVHAEGDGTVTISDRENGEIVARDLIIEPFEIALAEIQESK
jgi:hypothetical protein